jgi:type IV pilus assembly protein PilO
MDKFLDRFAEIPVKYKYLAVFGIVLVAVGLFYWLIYTEKQEEIQELDRQLLDLQTKLQNAENQAARYDEFKEELRQVELKLKEALKKLPVGREIPNLLDQINESVIDAGLTISLFRPAGQSPKEIYTEVPVDLQVSGGYHNFARFADVISKMERIVTLRNVNMSPQPGGEILTISCLAVTFRQVPSDTN